MWSSFLDFVAHHAVSTIDAHRVVIIPELARRVGAALPVAVVSHIHLARVSAGIGFRDDEQLALHGRARLREMLAADRELGAVEEISEGGDHGDRVCRDPIQVRRRGLGLVFSLHN